MPEWNKINLPPEEEDVLGLWKVRNEWIVKSFYSFNGQGYVSDFEGNTLPCPHPVFWKNIDDEFLPKFDKEN